MEGVLHGCVCVKETASKRCKQTWDSYVGDTSFMLTCLSQRTPVADPGRPLAPGV